VTARAALIAISVALLLVLALRGHGTSDWWRDPGQGPSPTERLPRCQDAVTIGCVWGQP
jgi:hypothetical protein